MAAGPRRQLRGERRDLPFCRGALAGTAEHAWRIGRGLMLASAVLCSQCEDRQSDILSMQKAAEASAPTAAPPEVLKELNSKEFRTEVTFRWLTPIAWVARPCSALIGDEQTAMGPPALWIAR